MKARVWLPASLAAAAVLGGVPLAASASSIDTKLQIGFSLHFTGPDSTAGTFVASGGVRDSGTSLVTHIELTPQGNQDDARLTGKQMFIGARGSITTTFSGLAGPLDDVHQTGKGTFEIVGGTGAYAGIKGRGRSSSWSMPPRTSSSARRTDRPTDEQPAGRAWGDADTHEDGGERRRENRASA